MVTTQPGYYATLLYAKMNLYVLLSMHQLTSVNQVCSVDGIKLGQMIFNGSLVLLIFDALMLLYFKVRGKYSDNQIFGVLFINVCWVLVSMLKIYNDSNINMNECPHVINLQQLVFYLHSTTTCFVVLTRVCDKVIKRITCLPITALGLYLILVNPGQLQCLQDNIFDLLIVVHFWLLALGIPFNLFMAINKQVKQPYIFLTIIGILLQIPTLYFIYQNGLNYETDTCQPAYSALAIHIVLSMAQSVFTLVYFIHYLQFEQQKQSIDIIKQQTDITMSTIQFVNKSNLQ